MSEARHKSKREEEKKERPHTSSHIAKQGGSLEALSLEV